MTSLLKIKHVHHILNQLLYKSDSIEHITNLKNTVKYYSTPLDDTELKSLTLAILKYALNIGAVRFLSINGEIEYSNAHQNITEAINLIDKEWVALQTIRVIREKEWLIEFWIEWTPDWRDELINLNIIKH